MIVVRPWGICFMAFSVCYLAGCRQASSPQPQQGWVRLESLTGLHPSRRMVTDLDRRLEGLALQRTRLGGRGTFTPPPVENTLAVETQPALPSTTAVVPPDRHLDAIHQEDLAALERALERDRQRRYVRQTREMSLTYAGKLRDTLATLEAAADVKRRAVTERYRLPALQADLRCESEQSKYETARVFAARDPQNARLQAQAQQALNRRDEAQRACQEIDETLAREMAAIERQLAADRDAARSANAEARKRALSMWDAAQRAENDRRLREETERLRVLREWEPTAPTIPGIHFSEMPAETLSLDSEEAFRDFSAADADLRRAGATDLASIERTMTGLTQERAALLATITEDTRATLRTLGTRHGYRISFTRGNGADVTKNARRWLQEYWPATEE